MASADTDVYGLIATGVMRFADNANIPNHPGNADWQRYQTWLAAGHTPRPLQPDATYVWNGTAWVQDPTLAANKNNAGVQTQLDGDDKAAIRSMRSIVNTLARLSPAFPPPGNTDQSYLINNEQSAQTTRKNWQPPAALTLTDAKALKIERLRVQGLAYIQIGFIAQTFRWRSSQDQVIYMSLCGYLVSGEIMLADSKIHIWDYNGVERALSPLNAGKLAGAMQAWLYIAQQEYWVQVAKVNACTTSAQVDAIVWTTRFTTNSPWNADTGMPTLLPFDEQPPTDDEILSQVLWT